MMIKCRPGYRRKSHRFLSNFLYHFSHFFLLFSHLILHFVAHLLVTLFCFFFVLFFFFQTLGFELRDFADAFRAFFLLWVSCMEFPTAAIRNSKDERNVKTTRRRARHVETRWKLKSVCKPGWYMRSPVGTCPAVSLTRARSAASR